MNTRPRILIVLALALLGCKSSGAIEGNIDEPSAKAATIAAPADSAVPAPRHEHVRFTWQSTTGSTAGDIEATLPDGEAFKGRFHEITSTTTVDGLGGAYGGWYSNYWSGPGWSWGGAWPVYGSAGEFITHYSGRVIAMLEGDRGSHIRCHFDLEDGERGIKGGGEGECQVSNGDRITAVFAPQ